jgi:hypothetical protein
MGAVLTELKSLCGAHPAKSNRVAGHLEKRIDLVIPPSCGAAAHREKGVWKAAICQVC